MNKNNDLQSFKAKMRRIRAELDRYEYERLTRYQDWRFRVIDGVAYIFCWLRDTLDKQIDWLHLKAGKYYKG